MLRDHAKRFAAIVGAIKRSVLRFDDCVNDVWITRRDANADASHQLRQTVGEFVPGAAAVDRFVNAAFLAAAAMRPGLALKTPHAGVKNVWVGRIDIEIRDAVLVVDVERFGPGLTAVRSHEHAAFFVWTKSMSECADVNDVRVLRMDGDGGDSLGVFETHVLPGLAAVSRFVNTVAKRNAVAHV